MRKVEKIDCDKCPAEALRTKELETETHETYYVQCTSCANEYAEINRKEDDLNGRHD